jgi:hypothetical protein
VLPEIVTVTDSVPDPSWVCAGVTVYDTAVDVEAENAVASVGVNVAVSEWDPSLSVAVSVATPEEFTVAGPRSVDPSLKSTVPAGIVVPEAGVTVAVSVSVDPCAAGDDGDTDNDNDVPTADDVAVLTCQLGWLLPGPLNVTVVKKLLVMLALVSRQATPTSNWSVASATIAATEVSAKLELSAGTTPPGRRGPNRAAEGLVALARVTAAVPKFATWLALMR